MFGKIVYGIPGDTVQHWGRMVTVNHRVVAYTKPFTKAGEPLVIGPSGVIPSGCYYVGTPHKDGFDCRYAAIGFACQRQIVGTGEADPVIRAVAASLTGVACLAGAMLLTSSQRGEARDFGQLGQTFPIVEADLLTTIEGRLQRAQATGEMRPD